MKNSLFLLLLTLSLSLFSLEEKPLWVEFQEAKALYERGEFQKALDFFLDSTKGSIPFPEAEYMIGLLYLEEGELDLAEIQVKKAIDNYSYLEVPEDLYDYKYTLSEIYMLRGDWDNYVYSLKDIIGIDEIDLDEIRDQKAYYDTFLESGVDRLLHLYRKKADNVLSAKVLLGYYYNSTGEYKESVNYLLPAMLSITTEVIDDNTLFDREYLFSSMSDFFKELGSNKRALEYFEENDFYKLFYYLAESLLGLGEKERALDIWRLLADSGIESKWVTKSKKQLNDPLLENWKLIY